MKNYTITFFLIGTEKTEIRTTPYGLVGLYPGSFQKRDSLRSTSIVYVKPLGDSFKSFDLKLPNNTASLVHFKKI
jgi:hypothetical protein